MGDFSDDYGGYDILGLYERHENERRAQRAKLLTPPKQEPVAWEQYAIAFAKGRKLTYVKPENLPKYIGVRALVYADTSPPAAQPEQESLECLDCGSNNVGIPANYDSLVDSVKTQPAETSAERTLQYLGYTNCGGEFWKPPLGIPRITGENT